MQGPEIAFLVQIVEAIAVLRGPAPVAADSMLEWPARYVELLLEQSAARKDASNRVSPDMITFSVAGSTRMSSVNKKLKVENEVFHLEREHSIDPTWQPGSPMYEDGLSKLRQHKMQGIQRDICELAQHLLIVEETFKRQATYRGDTKRLLQVKQRQKKKIQAALCFWAHWNAISSGATGEIPQQPVTEVSPEMVNAACRGHYPWQQDDETAGKCA